MTSKERVRAALNHEEPDRVPIDLGAHGASTIAAAAHMKLRKHLDLDYKEPPRMYNTWGLNCEVEPEILDHLGCDVVPLHRAISSFSIYNDGDWKEWTLADGSVVLVPEEFQPVMNEEGDWEWYENGEMIAKQPGEGLHGFTLFWAPIEGEPTKEKIDKLLDSENNNFVSRFKTSDREVAYVEREAKRLGETSDRAVLFQYNGTIMENAQGIFGWGEMFKTCITDPGLVHHCLDRMSQIHVETLSRLLPVCAEHTDVIMFGDDLGMQGGLLLPPNMYREIFLPYHRRIFQYVRENFPEIFVLLHCDGAITEVVPDLIEAGVQVLNPLQTDCTDMGPAKFKREFGKDLAIWGAGCDTHGTLDRGTPSQIREDVKRRIEILAQGGGYVFNQIHNVLAEVPPENVVAMLDAAREFGVYPMPDAASLEELEKRYSDEYWAHTFDALKAEGIA